MPFADGCLNSRPADASKDVEEFRCSLNILSSFPVRVPGVHLTWLDIAALPIGPMCISSHHGHAMRIVRT